MNKICPLLAGSIFAQTIGYSVTEIEANRKEISHAIKCKEDNCALWKKVIVHGGTDKGRCGLINLGG